MHYIDILFKKGLGFLKRSLFPAFFARKGAGFTLIELLVSVTIFTIVVGAGSGVFISALRAQQAAFAEQNLVDNTRFAIEFMSRQIRLAKRDGDGSCTGTANSTYSLSSGVLKFINSQNQCIHFKLSGDVIEVSTNGGSVFVGLTAASLVNVVDLSFTLSGELRSDLLQPRVTILLEAQAVGGGSVNPTTRIQTTVSTRNLDV